MKLLATPIIVSAAAFLLVACGGGTTPAPVDPNPTAPPTIVASVVPTAPPTPPATVEPSAPAGDVQKVSLQDSGGSGAYLFGPADLTFSVGDTITLELTSEGEFHTFTVDDLGIDVGVDPGSTETLEFTFAEAGTYTLICVPHEVLGMVGTITVQ